MNNTKKNAVILCRVSSREQSEGYSIDAQRNKLKKYCNDKNLNIIKEFTIIESSTRGDRKKFYEMLDFIKKTKNTYFINL